MSSSAPSTASAQERAPSVAPSVSPPSAVPAWAAAATGNQAALGAAGLAGGPTGGEDATGAVIGGMLPFLPLSVAVPLAWAHRQRADVRAWLQAQPIHAIAASVPAVLSTWAAEVVPSGRTVAWSAAVGLSEALGVTLTPQATLANTGAAFSLDFEGTDELAATFGLALPSFTDGDAVLMGFTASEVASGGLKVSIGWDLALNDPAVLRVLGAALGAGTLAAGLLEPSLLVTQLAAGLGSLPPARWSITTTPGLAASTGAAAPALPLVDTPSAGADVAAAGYSASGLEEGRRYLEIGGSASGGVFGALGLAPLVEGLGGGSLVERLLKVGQSFALRVQERTPGVLGESLADRAARGGEGMSYRLTLKRDKALGSRADGGGMQSVTDVTTFDSPGALSAWVAAQAIAAQPDPAEILARADAGAGGRTGGIPDVSVERSLSLELADDEVVEGLAPGFMSDLARYLPERGSVRGTTVRRVEARVKVTPVAVAAFVGGPAGLLALPEEDVVRLEQAVIDAVLAVVATGGAPTVGGRDISAALPHVALVAPSVVVESVVEAGGTEKVGAGLVASASAKSTVTVTDKKPAAVGDIARLLTLLAG